MKNKLWNPVTQKVTIIVVALIVAGIGFVWNKSDTNSKVKTVAVLVAKTDISPFTEVTSANTEIRNIVKSEVPEDALTSVEQLKSGDSFASSYGFVSSSPIRSSYVTTAADSKLGTSIVLKKGSSELGVKVDLITSAGAEMKSGTLVDAIASIKEQSGATRTIENEKLHSIKVLSVKNAEGRGIDPNGNSSLVPAVAVLEVSTEQRTLLVQYQEAGKVYLTPAGDQTETK